MVWFTLVSAQDAVTSATKRMHSVCETIIQYSDPKVIIKAKSGVRFQIALVSNPTTGYSWNVDESAFKGGFIKLISSEFIPSDSKMAGSPGEEIWVFEPLKRGRCELKFEYSRKWEKGIPAIDKKIFKIKIIK